MKVADKIITNWAELKSKLDALKAEEKTIAFTNGCFDILHRGHIDYLEKSKEKGDVLVVALNTDESVKRLGKGESRPLNPFSERAFHMAGLQSIDFVTEFNEDTPKEIIEFLLPDVVIKGGDYDVNTFVGSEFTRNRGGKAFIIQFVDGFSTTKWLEGVYEKISAEKAAK